MKRLFKILLYGIIGFILLGIVGIGAIGYRAKVGLPFYDHTPPELPSEWNDFSILVFSKTNGFPHSEAIKAAIPAFEKIAKENNWSIVSTKNAAVFNKEQLANFDVVIWNNATGKNLTDEQRSHFRQYIEEGGAYVGIHGAGDSSHSWDWYYKQLIGANFSHHSLSPHIQEGLLNINCPKNHSYPCIGLPEKKKHHEEWYVFHDNPRENDFKVLYTLDETGLEMSGNIPILVSDKDFGMGEDHPIVWFKCLPNGGRTFYSALGHTGASFSEAFHLDILERGIKWAGGLTGKCE